MCDRATRAIIEHEFKKTSDRCEYAEREQFKQDVQVFAPIVGIMLTVIAVTIAFF